MDSKQFDVFTRSWSATASRRAMLALFAGSALGLHDFLESEAKRKKKRKKKKKKKTASPPPASPPAVSPPPPPLSPPPPPSPQLAYTCAPIANAEVLNLPALTRVAQTFTPVRNGLLRQIVFPIDKAVGSVDGYHVQLLTVDSSGVPVQQVEGVLAEVVIPNNAVATGQSVTVTADFNGPSLVAGILYAAALSRFGPDGYQCRIRLDAGCSGQGYIAGQGQPFTAFSNPDARLIFSVLIST